MERHRIDPVSLVFGLLFVAVATVGLVGRFGLHADDLRWLAPGLLVVLGVLLVLPLGRSTRETDPGDGGEVRSEPHDEATTEQLPVADDEA